MSDNVSCIGGANMTVLLSELARARHCAASGAMVEAQQHIAEALELLDDALDGRPGPKPSARSIRGYLADAQFAMKSGDSNRAVVALGFALDAIEAKSEGE